jgi:hypothetical protein
MPVVPGLLRNSLFSEGLLRMGLIDHTVLNFECFWKCLLLSDRLCGLVVGVEDYKHRGPGFDSLALLRIYLRELGLERGPLSLVIG